jgi:hypothetical protein
MVPLNSSFIRNAIATDLFRFRSCMITAVCDVIFTFSSIQPSALLKSWKQHNPLHPVSEIVLAPLVILSFIKYLNLLG